MATLESQIQALIAYANETTGKSDTHLGEAVKSLIDGYGGEGGGEVVEGEYTLSTPKYLFQISLPEGKGTPDIISVECLEDYVESSAYTPRAVFALIRPVEHTIAGMIGIGVVKGFNGNNDWFGGGAVISTPSNFSLVLTDTYFQMYSSNSARNWVAGRYRYRFYYNDGYKADIIPPADEVWIWGKTEPITQLAFGHKAEIISSEYDGEKLVTKFSGIGSLGEGFIRNKCVGYITAIGANFSLANAYQAGQNKPTAILRGEYALHNVAQSSYQFSSTNVIYVPDCLVETYQTALDEGKFTAAGVRPLSAWKEVFNN